MPKPMAVPLMYGLNWPGVSVLFWHSTIRVSERSVPTSVVMPEPFRFVGVVSPSLLSSAVEDSSAWLLSSVLELSV